MSVIKFPWRKYDEYALEIVAYLDNAKFIPDVIIGIARGGLPLMVTLSSYYNVRSTGVIFMEKTTTDEEFAQRHHKVICKGYYLPSDINNQKVLLVDDIIRTGDTLSASLEMINGLKPGLVRVVTLFKQDDYDFKSYAPISVKSDDWIKFPWDDLNSKKNRDAT